VPHRILILTNRVPYPFTDGGNLAMHAMIEGYYRAGWEVYLLAMNTKRHPVPDTVLRTAYSHIQYVETVPVDNSVKLAHTITNLLFSKQPNHADRFSHRQFADKLVEVLKKFQPDIVQLESLYLASYLPSIKKYCKAHTILRLHNVEHEVWQRLAVETVNPLKKWYLNNLSRRIKKFEHDIWPRFDLLLPITKADENVVKQVMDSVRTIVVPFAIDTSLLPITAKEAQWNAYHIGAMDWLPNIEAIKWFLDEVWPSVHLAHPQFKFFFAGRKMPVEFTQITYPGVVCEGEVADAFDFIGDKKILVVPLRSGGGIRIKVMEAMAAGKIVISTTVGMQGIDAVPGVHYLLANTAAEFAQAITFCLHDQKQANVIAAMGAGFIQQEYSYTHIMNTFMGKLEDMLMDNRA